MNSYIEAQSRADARYLAAWDDLSAEQRALLAANGVKGPDCSHTAGDYGREVVGREEDAGDVAARTMGVEDKRAEDLCDELAERFGLDAAKAREIAAYVEQRLVDAEAQVVSLKLSRVVGFFLLSSDNLQARAHGLAHACRMAKANGLFSLRKSAVACGVSVEWMRRVAWKWCQLLDLPPLEGAKSAEACAAYAENAKTNHWRNRPCNPLTLNNLLQQNPKG